jgi:hypothetical protein
MEGLVSRLKSLKRQMYGRAGREPASHALGCFGKHGSATTLTIRT